MEQNENETSRLREIAQQSSEDKSTLELVRKFWRTQREFYFHCTECKICRFNVPTKFTCVDGFSLKLTAMTMFNVIGYKIGELQNVEAQ